MVPVDFSTVVALLMVAKWLQLLLASPHGPIQKPFAGLGTGMPITGWLGLQRSPSIQGTWFLIHLGSQDWGSLGEWLWRGNKEGLYVVRGWVGDRTGSAHKKALSAQQGADRPGFFLGGREQTGRLGSITGSCWAPIHFHQVLTTAL